MYRWPTSAAAQLDVDFRGRPTAAANEMKYVVTQLVPAMVRVDFDLALGTAGDKLEAKIVGSGSSIVTTGRIAARGGDDDVLLETDGARTTSGLVMDGGDGSDKLFHQISGEYQMSQSLGPRFLGGNGVDFLRLGGHTLIRGTGLPADASPVLDGGPGLDLFWGFGFILNCEGRF